MNQLKRRYPKKSGGGGLPLINPGRHRTLPSNSENVVRPVSPRWSNTVKLIVGFTIIAVVAFLLARFRNLIGPLLVSFIIAFLLQPVAQWFSKKTKISWRATVTILYLLVLILVLGTLTASGVVLVDQVTRLVNFLENQIGDINDFILNLANEPLVIGPIVIDPAQFEIDNLVEKLLGLVEPAVSQVGSLLKTLATGVATTIGWTFFALIVSYFVLAETGINRSGLFSVKLPGYAEDVRRIGRDLTGIWNSFLRGQLIIVFITIIIYDVLLGTLGVNFFIGLAFLAGIARFVPYVGPAVAWAAYGLVAYFQGSTIFGLTPFFYALLVVGLAWLIDVILDNFVVPRLMGDALQVHPAAVMVAALVSAQLFGVIGVVLAAPVLATIKLISSYAIYKLFDQDPWQYLKPTQRKKQANKRLSKVLEFGRRLLNSIRQQWFNKNRMGNRRLIK